MFVAISLSAKFRFYVRLHSQPIVGNRLRVVPLAGSQIAVDDEVRWMLEVFARVARRM